MTHPRRASLGPTCLLPSVADPESGYLNAMERDATASGQLRIRKIRSSYLSSKEKKFLQEYCKLSPPPSPPGLSPASSPAATHGSSISYLSVCNYNLVQRLGAGAGGQVFLGRHVSDNSQKAAIKIAEHNPSFNSLALPSASLDNSTDAPSLLCFPPTVLPSFALSPSTTISEPVAMLRREKAVLSELPPHRHVIKLLGSAEDTRRMCLLLEYAEGGDLFQYVCKWGKLPEWEAWRLFRQIVQAVAHIHSQGFFHRDLKPENILLNKRMDAVLADFGHAGKWSSAVPKKRSCGSLHYTAPEVLLSHQYVGPEVDIWSCGAVLYFMLTGKVPFQADNTLAVTRRIRSGAIKLPTYLSAGVKDLITRLLTPHSFKRIHMMDVLQHPWIKNSPRRHRSSSLPFLPSISSLCPATIAAVMTPGGGNYSPPPSRLSSSASVSFSSSSSSFFSENGSPSRASTFSASSSSPQHSNNHDEHHHRPPEQQQQQQQPPRTRRRKLKTRLVGRRYRSQSPLATITEE
ncbi:Serine/threonine-protein kinase hsl1 [Balamuthia mandrillaris]